MRLVQGTLGYAEVASRYAAVTDDVSFEALHASFLPYLPSPPSRVLDVGAGTGRDAVVLAALGHEVLAVEPCSALREVGIVRHGSSNATFLEDALPELKLVDGAFDFVLASSVWHHLDPEEQLLGLDRVAELLAPGGVFCLSLRNGPAGAGRHVFPTDSVALREHSERLGLRTLLHEIDQPSLLPGKPKVRWARLALRRSVPPSACSDRGE